MITILIGESGAGKDHFLKRSIDKGFTPIVSYTTRPMRDGEIDGREYFFMTDKEFCELEFQKPDFFLEKRKYHAIHNNKDVIWTYGSPKVNPNDNNYMTVLDVQGAVDYIKAYGSENIEVIYIKASENLRIQRAVKRDPNGFDKAEWDKRAADDAEKFKNCVSVIDDTLSDKQVHIFFNNDTLPCVERRWDKLIDELKDKALQNLDNDKTDSFAMEH